MQLQPESPEQFTEALREAAARGTVRVAGSSTKDAMAGPIAPAETTITTAAMRRVLRYEPRDLTISVEAGLPFRELTEVLAENRQMLPLDPPFADQATVGGVVAANCSGPRRRLYGTARDLIIGMKFATVAGKLVQSGGMVVKNVAGLDMAKLMVGSFGTLAAITVVNFKVLPQMLAGCTFALPFDSLSEAIAGRDRILQSVLEPAAVDLLNPAAAALARLSGFVVLVRASGNPAVLERYARELGTAAVEPDRETPIWRQVTEFTPLFLSKHPEGAVVRTSGVLSQVGPMVESIGGPVVARAASGVCYGYFEDVDGAVEWLGRTAGCGWKSVIEYAPPEKKAGLALWPDPGRDLEKMVALKRMFDPTGVLNTGRLYGRI